MNKKWNGLGRPARKEPEMASHVCSLVFPGVHKTNRISRESAFLCRKRKVSLCRGLRGLIVSELRLLSVKA